MDFWNSLRGMLRLELTSADMGGALDKIRERKIDIFHLEYKTELNAVFMVKRRDFAELESLCADRGYGIRILERKGLFWYGHQLWNRPVLLTGLAVFILGVYILPGRILFVRVAGNERIETNRILEAAQQCGIGFGASRRIVRSEKAKNSLLSEIPDLQWAGINTYGCVAVISVREKPQETGKEASTGVSNIVAARDGIVTEVILTRGSGLCVTGQAVEEGQVLISGYSDCGLCLIAARAEGEIYADTGRSLTMITPASCLSPGKVYGEKRKYSILLGKKRINLWKDSGIWDSTCDRMYEENYITLPGGFLLPLGLAVETYILRQMQETALPQEEAYASMSAYAETYLAEQMISGIVNQKTEHCAPEEDVYILRGNYSCTEMIGREQKVQIGEAYGQTN